MHLSFRLCGIDVVCVPNCPFIPEIPFKGSSTGQGRYAWFCGEKRTIASVHKDYMHLLLDPLRAAQMMSNPQKYFGSTLGASFSRRAQTGRRT